MAYATIDKGSKYFNTVLYTGDGTTANSVTGVGFQPDLVWIKGRTGNREPVIQDSVRGTFRYFATSGTGTENTNSNYDWFKSFNSDGFTVAYTSSNSITTGEWNNSGTTYASWNWLGANTTATNTSGSITSTVSANTTSGFSIVSYTGAGASATIGHGLGVAPSMYIIKSRTGTAEPWFIYNKSIGNTGGVLLNSTNAQVTSSTWFNNTSPTSSVFSIGSNSGVSGSGKTHIAYCFAEVKGYSKFGSYTGNGSADGTFVYTGFKPAFVMEKSSSVGGYSWAMSDNKRNPFNQANNTLYANAADAEYTSLDKFDLLSNGFKLRSIYGNTTGDTYIYMAFAENPFVSSTSIPTTAR